MTPPIDLDPYKDEIINMVRRGEANGAILTTLANDYGISVSLRTLKNRLGQWGIRRSTQDAALDRLVLQLYTMALSSDEVLRVLQEQGNTMTERTLRRIRKRLGICLRCVDPVARACQADEIREILLVEDAVGEIEGFGRRLQYVFLRSQGAFFPRDLIFEVYRYLLRGLFEAF